MSLSPTEINDVFLPLVSPSVEEAFQTLRGPQRDASLWKKRTNQRVKTASPSCKQFIRRKSSTPKPEPNKSAVFVRG
jgi:hypothetical protein